LKALWSFPPTPAHPRAQLLWWVLIIQRTCHFSFQPTIQTKISTKLAPLKASAA
jgi:hypothetical protein